MKNYWNHRDAETEMLLAAAFYQLVRPGYGEKFRDAVKEVMAKVCANPSAFTPKRRGVRKACFKSPFPYAVYYREVFFDVIYTRWHKAWIGQPTSNRRRWLIANRDVETGGGVKKKLWEGQGRATAGSGLWYN